MRNSTKFNAFFTSFLLPLVLIVLCAGGLIAASTDHGPAKKKSSALLREVEEHYRAALTIKMNVSKILKLKLLQKERRSEGVIQMKKGGKLRWETETPDHSMVLADGKVIWPWITPAEQDEKVHVIVEGSEPAQKSAPRHCRFFVRARKNQR